MGVGASAQRGPPGADGKDGAPGKDAVVDYIELVSKTVTNDAFKNQVKALLGDQTFKTIVTDYMNANIGTFRGPKGETEFKNLTAEEQSQIITKLINNNMTTFSVQLMANNSFKDAILQMLESNPVNFKGLQGQQGPPGVGIKDASYDTATRNLMFIRTDNNTIGSFMVRGAEGPPGPAGTIDTPANTAWLQERTMWCADGSCKTPTGNGMRIVNDFGESRPALTRNVPGGYEIRSLKGNAADAGFLRLSAGGGTNAVGSYIDVSGYNTAADLDNNIVFGTNGAERARIDNAGLSVNGNVHMAPNKILRFNDSNGDKVYWSGNAYKTGIADWGMYHDIPDNKQHVFKVNNTDRMKIGKDTIEVGGPLNVNGNVILPGGSDADIKGPNGNLKMNKHGIMFGGANAAGKDTNSAQISAGMHGPGNNFLDLVGMGTDGTNRKIRAWAEGGFHVNGPIVIQNEVDGGPSKGIRMWASNFDNWGIYMASPGAGKAMNGGETRTTAGINNHAIRFRANKDPSNGFIFENSENTPLMGINANTGDVHVAGKLIVNGRDILAELDNRPRFNNDWVAIESGLGNKCLDVGSHNANCDRNAGGWRQFKFVKW